MAEQCDNCHQLLIEINQYGSLLLGCIHCNKWSDPDGAVVELDEEDIAVLRGISAEVDVSAEKTVELALAKRNAESLEAYVARGRQLQNLSAEELAEKLKEAVAHWATHLREGNLVSDVMAEYELRGIIAPSPDSIPGWSAIMVAVERSVEQMTEEQMKEIATDLHADAEGIKKGQH
jgi:hypothetical protein